MKIQELLEAVSEAGEHLWRAYDYQDVRHIEGPYYIANDEHDPGQFSSTLLKKVVDTNDRLTPAFQDLGLIKVSSYARWPEVVAAAKKMIAGLSEDWQKVNKKDKTDGMSKKAVKAYRRENPGSKLKTAVTTKPSKLKKGSKDAKRRKSFCARMSGVKGPMKDEKGRPTPKAKALSRWNCEE